ncbi:major histocompatibility complex class I-related protein 1-like [Paroedura picta]|uniref:major histocompatibility complex class I-related protein 1-like n=1 Tax=Paroedura picta TaxID=143630 RepID=UPI004055B43B
MGVFWGCPLLLVVTAFLLGDCSDSLGHSLRFLCTVIWEPGQGGPDFKAVMYLDDQLSGHYNTTTRKAVSEGHWAKEMVKQEPHILNWFTWETRNSEQRMKYYLMSQTHLYNKSRGLHIWQRTVSCAISKEGHKRGLNQHAYDGEDYLCFDENTLTWTAAVVPAQLTKRTWDEKRDDLRAVKAFLEDTCIWWLEKFLKYGKESLLRRELPKVTVRRRPDFGGLETLICRAHGFHPKEIDATWRKDGEVWEQETFRGGVVPNSDGTYHTWLSIKVHPEDRSRYRCHVEHDSLPEPLDEAWVEPASSWTTTSINKMSLAPFGVLAAAVVLIVFGIWYWRRIHQAAQKAPPDPVDHVGYVSVSSATAPAVFMSLVE